MKSAVCLVVVCLASLLPNIATSAEEAPVVKLKQGELQGIISKTRNGADYYAYWGIPYAKPPKRFQRPEPPAIPSWKGVRNAAVPGSVCLQFGFFDRKLSGAEDCLFANVFTKSVDSETKKPVIVYIHPGAFMFSSGDAYGADYFLDENVVLVTFNYRLSSLGFLNVGHFGDTSKSELATGNMGLKDQVQALKWVRDNIEGFGGDPDKVTIFGTSAGAASVIYHMLSPMSKGLFRHAIAASGTALNSWAFTPNPTLYAKELGKRMECPVSTSDKLVECLLNKDANEIVEKSYANPIKEWPLDPLAPFGPSIEVGNGNTVFLSEHPETLLRKGKFQKVPLLTGVTKHEGLLLHASFIIANDALLQTLNANWDKIVPLSLTLEGKIPESKWIEASEEIRTFYFGAKDGELDGDGLEQMYTDRYFQHGIKSTILHMAKETDVYPYVFNYWTPDSGFQKFFPQQDLSGKVFHADDVLYGFSGPVFGLNLNPDNPESNEFSKNYVKLIMSFVNKGAPDGSVLGTVKWPKTSEEQATQKKPLKWYQLAPEPTLDNETFTFRMKFWDNLFKKYGTIREEL